MIGELVARCLRDVRIDDVMTHLARIAEHDRYQASLGIERAAELMERYSDRPMDLADATLVALAEDRSLKRIFTLDNDFHIYRLHDREHFEVVP